MRFGLGAFISGVNMPDSARLRLPKVEGGFDIAFQLDNIPFTNIVIVHATCVSTRFKYSTYSKTQS